MDDFLRRVGEQETHDLVFHRESQRFGAAGGVIAELAIHLVVLQGVAAAHDAEDFLGGFWLGVLGAQGRGEEQRE